MAESNREEIAKLEALYANNPGGRVFTHLAEAYRKAGDLKQAREILEEGLTRHADYASAYVVLGRVLVDQGAAPEAAASFRRVLQLDHENRVALRSLGDLARTAGAPAEALTYYYQLQQLDPTDDELNEIVEALTAQANAAPAAGEPPPEPAAPEAVPRPEPEPEPKPEPIAAKAAQPAEPEPVPGDFPMDWASDEEEAGDLPGDLAQFAMQSLAQETPSAEVAPESEDPLSTFDLGLDAPPAEETPEPFADFSLDDATTEAAQDLEFDGSDFGVDPAGSGADTFATEPRESSFEELLSSSTSGPGPLAVAGAQEDMPTETLAELYRSQGLADRAAGVYRTLLQQKPGDAQLLAKLAEVETIAPSRAPETPSRTGPEEPAAPAEPETREAWHEGVAAWTGGEGVAAGGPSPYDWSHEGEHEESDGTTVAEYLERILAWRPQNAGDFSFEDGADDSRNVAMMEGVVEMMAVTEPAATPEAQQELATAGRVPDAPADPPTEPGAETAVAAPRETPVTPAPVAEAPAVPTAAAAAPAQYQRPSPSESSGSAVDVAFDEWFAEPGETSAPASSAAQSATSSESVAPASPEAAGDEETDDDLEMFRSWLQSLKK